MGRVGRVRYIYFRVVDINSNPITGLTLGSFVKFFTRNGVTCTDPVTLIEIGSGRYVAEYTPTAPGFDFFELYNATNAIRTQDEDQIDDDLTLFDIGSATVDLTQDYGGSGRLKVTSSNPQDYVLYLFRSGDWQAGRTAVSYSIAATTIDSLGNWVSFPLTVLKDTYHVVAMNPLGAINVISAFLRVI